MIIFAYHYFFDLSTSRRIAHNFQIISWTLLEHKHVMLVSLKKKCRYNATLAITLAIKCTSREKLYQELGLQSPLMLFLWSSSPRRKCPYSGPYFSRIFPHSDWIRRDTVSVISPNAGKCGKNADQNNSKYGLLLRSA